MDDITLQLQAVGLGKAETEIYTALMQHGELRIKEIVYVTNIPRSSVYEGIRELAAKNLVQEIIWEQYNSYRACPITDMSNTLREEIGRLQKIDMLLPQLNRNLQKLNKNSATIDDSNTVKYFRGISGARQLIWNTLKAKDIVYVYSQWGRSDYVGEKYYEQFVLESQKRNIREKVIINPFDSTLKSIKDNLNNSLSRTRTENIRAIDFKHLPIVGETFLYDNIYSQIYLQNDHVHGFEIHNTDFVLTQRSIFKILWRQAKNVDDNID